MSGIGEPGVDAHCSPCRKQGSCGPSIVTAYEVANGFSPSHGAATRGRRTRSDFAVALLHDVSCLPRRVWGKKKFPRQEMLF